MRRAGFVATCNPRGAGKWRTEFEQYFHGARDVIIPDNDDKGRAHADQVGDALAPVAGYVLVLMLPEPSMDVSNWFDQGGSIGGLRELAAQAPRWKPSAEEQQPPAGEPPDLGEWDDGDDDRPIPPREWLLGNVFCRGFVSSLISGGAGGKSALRHLQALALTTTRPLSGEHVFRR